MRAHISCRPVTGRDGLEAGCFVVWAAHDLRRSFGTAHAVAHAACVEHNRLHHPEVRGASPRLMSLIYESSATAPLTGSDLEELLGQARSSNSSFGITGMLLAEDGWFLQALEGPETIVEDLMRVIRRDPRHGHIRVLAREFLPQRRFPDWSMAHGRVGDVEALPLAHYYEALLMARGEIVPAGEPAAGR